jgi:3-hexulose-6-phosphate synthase
MRYGSGVRRDDGPRAFRRGQGSRTAIMKHETGHDSGQARLDRLDAPYDRRIGRRSFLGGAGRVAVGGLTAGTIVGLMRPTEASAQSAAKETHAASARVVERLNTRFTFQISVDVATLEQGRAVAAAALAGGVHILEMGTPLLKNQGVANVVPAFRQQFPEALLLADMKTMDGGAFEARAVYAGGGNIVDFLALAGVDTAKAICAVRDEFRRAGPDVPRLAFADIMVPHQGPAAQAIEVARRMMDAGVDGVGIHLQSDGRRADPSLIERDYLGDVARTVFEGVGKTAPVQVVGGLHAAQAKRLARAGLRSFVISGNLGLPDTLARYDLPPAQIERHVAAFIAEVSSG